MKNISASILTTLGARLRGARVAAGKTQEEVAAHLQVARTTIVAIENGSRRVRAEELTALSKLYGLAVNALLHQDQQVDFSLQFRRSPARAEPSDVDGDKVKSMLQRLAAAYVDLEVDLGRPLRYDYAPERPLPRARLFDYAEDLALELRGRLGVANHPIADLISLAETELTIRVFERRLPSRISGAFAFSDATGACVLLNVSHPRTRRTWTLAHEIGHFLVNRTMGDIVLTTAEDSEQDAFADLFAAALLLPASAIRQRFDATIEREGKFSTRSLVYLARSFFVSLEAMGRRLERLKLLPSGTYERLKSQGLSAKLVRAIIGNEDAHSASLPAPQRFNLLVAEAFAEGRVTEGQATSALGLDRLEVRELLDALGEPGTLAVVHG